jgi:hypothetical protein
MTPAMINSTIPTPYSRPTCFDVEPSACAEAAGWGGDGIGPTGMGALPPWTGTLGVPAACDGGGGSATAGVATLIHKNPLRAPARSQCPERGNRRCSTTKTRDDRSILGCQQDACRGPKGRGRLPRLSQFGSLSREWPVLSTTCSSIALAGSPRPRCASAMQAKENSELVGRAAKRVPARDESSRQNYTNTAPHAGDGRADWLRRDLLLQVSDRPRGAPAPDRIAGSASFEQDSRFDAPTFHRR